ncbi:GST-like protein [Azospirillum lipoferum]|uniref:Glutathione S-transferase family protein n=1 Tax=Azospirillum lipoferum TaxID=193 RepID=A0A5A9GNY1_AZOLI|nr:MULTISPECIES: glutathione S-transferase family protein [Azospirillum]KAA0596090.1 glutathione S-transferase family protein [Azospirillum lipoferum]MCP1611033.1 GST-like protein [Azospirillum lipoferum]MDW5533837.1 glutathione S-transferase family protein [Azospirillum sp. NL1]
MIELYAFATPNSVKVPIALEEMGLSYDLKPINIRQGEQKAADFLALNPNGKVPVLVDGALVLTESAAILVHLAEKTGRLLPRDGMDRARVFEQLFFHASALSPAFGNAGFFKRLAAEPQPLAEARFTAEANRVLDRIDALLGERRFVAGDDFTIADIAHFGWLWRREFPGMTLDGRPNLVRWFDTVAARPAVRRAIARVEAVIPQAA